jgi:hypothetical protein
MADNKEPEQPRNDDTQTIRREIKSLQARLKVTPKKEQLSWDTELVVKKKEDFDNAEIISTTNPEWKKIVVKLEIGPNGICISDVRSVDAIEFIASFAAQRQLKLTYGNRSFVLEPRVLPE